MKFLWVTVSLFGVASALYPSGGDVVELTPSNFDSTVRRSDGVWVVEFFAPWCGHCKNLVPEYTKAAAALKGVVGVGAVDADRHKQLGSEYGVTGFPTVKIFSGGSSDKYEGPRTAAAIVEAALKAAKKRVEARLSPGGKSGGGGKTDDVVQLTDSNFDRLVLQSEDMWLVEFYAPWCGHCKKLEPEWAEAAARLRGKVKLGALDATEHRVEAGRFNVEGYPTIKMFPPGKKDAGSATDYDGGRSAADIADWALERLAENVPAPEPVQVTGPDSFRDACGDRPLCAVAVLPHILDCDASCRNAYLDVLRAAADKYRRKMWGWAWAEGGAQPELEDALEIGGFGYPAMAAVNPKKLKCSLLRGAFSQRGIDEFLRDLSFGRGQTAPVRGAEMPRIRESEPWDGKDGVPPQEEDTEPDRDEL